MRDRNRKNVEWREKKEISMTKCSVSVIIPVYNQEKYLTECLDSVLSQDMDGLEVLCIDDGSTDNSLNLLKTYSERDNRMTVLTQANQGVAKTRNRGIQCAQGDFIIFCDPDDFYPSPAVIRSLYEAAVKNGVMVAGGSFSRYNDKTGAITTEFDGMYEGYAFDKDCLIEYKDYQFDYGFHRFLFKRAFLLDNAILFPEYMRYQDPPFLVKALNAAGSFYAISGVVYRYRKNHTTVKWTAEKAYDLTQALADILSYSSANGLWNLHALTVSRINLEHRKILVDYASDLRVLTKLCELNSLIDWDELKLLNINYAPASSEMLRPLSDVLEILASRNSLSQVNAKPQDCKPRRGLVTKLKRAHKKVRKAHISH